MTNLYVFFTLRDSDKMYVSNFTMIPDSVTSNYINITESTSILLSRVYAEPPLLTLSRKVGYATDSFIAQKSLVYLLSKSSY